LLKEIEKRAHCVTRLDVTAMTWR